jgi:NADH-quinone oxidoreductase subunit F
VDLHVIGPLATAAERAAVDAVVGPPDSGWHGGPRDVRTDGHVGRGGHAARARRDLLLPALHAVQARFGHISQPALNYICKRLSVPPAEAYGVATFYALLSTTPEPPNVAHVCDDLACRLAGAEETAAALARTLGSEGAPARDGTVTWHRSPCLGMCERAPAALFTAAGERPVEQAAGPIDAAGVVARLELSAAQTLPTLPTLGELQRSVPQADEPESSGLRLIGRIGRIDPLDLEGYRADGGYEGLRRAIEAGPAATIAEITTARLVGRGGAAFPTGRKWEAVAGQAATPHYVICNADESEPGTFKDRLLMEGDPFAVLEGMTIAALATGAERGFIYVRAEYPAAAETLRVAIERARTAGLLGPDVMGAGFSFDIEIRRGAGAYICGEETALFNSIEGKRGEPRNKPPFPVTHGLFGKPTVINNVETLVNVPLILREGGAAYAARGTEGSAGLKLFCLSGHVGRPGLYEVPFGATLGDLIAMAGGVPGGRGIGAVLLGGAAGAFVGPDGLDVPLTFEGTRDAGATLGSGVVLVYDDAADLLDALRRIAAFFRDESCGQCVPCRVGTVRQEELLARLLEDRPIGDRAMELRLLADIGQAMRDASICGLGQTASAAIESAVRAGLVVA